MYKMAFLCVEYTGWSPKVSVLHPVSLRASYFNAIDFSSREYDIQNWCSVVLINSICVVSMYDYNLYNASILSLYKSVNFVQVTVKCMCSD